MNKPSKHRVVTMIGLTIILAGELTAWGWLKRNEYIEWQQHELEMAKQRFPSGTLIIVEPEPSPFRLLALSPDRP